jgi:Tol biopolymer transport system component
MRSRAIGVIVAALLGLAVSATASSAGVGSRTGTIAFLRTAPGASEPTSLFAMGADGSNLRRLTPPGVSVLTYRWSPDGKLIAYVDQSLSLWLVRPDGTERRVLLPTSQLSTLWGLSWAPDSTAIAIGSAGPDANPRTAGCSGLYVVPIDGATPVRLPAGRHVGCDVAWSPHGDEIAYDNGGVFVIRPDGTDRRRVSELGGGPEWSADGMQLAFNVAIHRKGTNRLARDRYHAFAVINADGTHFHVVTTRAYNEYGQVWSPSGRRILYGRKNRAGIFVISADGRNNRRVTRDSPPQTDWPALAWSPDGRSTAYDTDRTGNGDIYVIGADGRHKMRLTSSADNDVAPSWVAR